MINSFSKKAIIAIALSGLMCANTPAFAIHEGVAVGVPSAVAIATGITAAIAFSKAPKSPTYAGYHNGKFVGNNYKLSTSERIKESLVIPSLILGGVAVAASAWALWRVTPRGKINRAKRLVKKTEKHRSYKATEPIDYDHVKDPTADTSVQRDEIEARISQEYASNKFYYPSTSAWYQFAWRHEPTTAKAAKLAGQAAAELSTRTEQLKFKTDDNLKGKADVLRANASAMHSRARYLLRDINNWRAQESDSNSN